MRVSFAIGFEFQIATTQFTAISGLLCALALTGDDPAGAGCCPRLTRQILLLGIFLAIEELIWSIAPWARYGPPSATGCASMPAARTACAVCVPTMETSVLCLKK